MKILNTSRKRLDFKQTETVPKLKKRPFMGQQQVIILSSVDRKEENVRYKLQNNQP